MTLARREGRDRLLRLWTSRTMGLLATFPGPDYSGKQTDLR
jgi:hypothetical protein